MSGAANQRGLIYQQRYLVFRVLSALGLRATATATDDHVLAEFSVEGRTSRKGPAWDVRLAFTDGAVDLHECKDTKITKDDRLAFYDRLRAEVASGTPVERIRAVLVTDPGKQTPNSLAYLGGMAAAVSKQDLRRIAKTAPARMSSTASAVREAVYRLCHYRGPKGRTTGFPRRCTLDEAKALLSQVRIDERRFTDLSTAIGLLATGVFTKGTADAVSAFITGTLTEAVVKRGEARYTVDGFVEAVGTAVIGHEVEGRVRRILSFRAGSGFEPPMRLIEWASLPNKRKTWWELAERLPAYNPEQSSLVVASMGVGKTVASQLAFRDASARLDPRRVLRLEASELEQDDLDSVVRAACLLAGVGPTWLALDGLDEIPHNLRIHWSRSISELASLPNLVLFLTVRKEVYAVHEWIARATTGLTAIELLPVQPAQVRAAFAEAGLRVPSNPRLIAVLENPFLLSLYADVVTNDDLPLAESGEATAFVVVHEFWQRRVRGVSIGQRAIGESDLSQEPKRKAAVFLGERALAGDLVVRRDSPDPQVSSGIAMLLREGVLREQGAEVVAWIHEWFREYAVVDRLLSRSNETSAVTLARRIGTDCAVDHVARSAAAGGLKWVVANPDAGSPEQFLSELWLLNKGAAREALAVLLEGSVASASLGELSDELLSEALTLAVNLGATQWSDQVAALPDERSFGALGDELHRLAIEFELRVVPGQGGPEASVVERLAARDSKRLQAGRGYAPGAYRELIEKAVSTGAYRAPTVRAWLATIALLNDALVLDDLLKAISAMIAAGDIDVAHEIYRPAAGLTNQSRREAITESLVNRRFVFGRPLVGILCTAGLLARDVHTWGQTAVEFLAALIESKQRLNWPSSRRFMRALAEAAGVALPGDDVFQVDHDQEPRLTTLAQDEDEEPIVQIAAALAAALRDLAAAGDPMSFDELATAALQSRFAAIIVLPMLALYDAFRGAEPIGLWHVPETIRLLSDYGVAELESLADARRLLRRQLPSDLGQPAKEAIAEAIRRAGINARMRTVELSDLRSWGVLTANELDDVERAAAADEIGGPTDPREEPLFTLGRGERPDRPVPGTGWPHPEDERLIHLLERGVTEPDQPAPDEMAVLARRLEALRVVLGREAATGDDWIGRALGWCHGAVERLRRTLEPEDGARGGLPLGAEVWAAGLDEQASWWRQMADVALGRLAAPVPESHAKRELKDSRLSWFSGDPILNALDLLDELLAIAPSPPFDMLQLRLVETITSNWNTWPPFVRATALSSLRSWYWNQFPALRSLLTVIVESEPNPVVVRYAVDRLVEIACASPAPELRDFLLRALDGRQNDALKQVAQLCGASEVGAALPSPGTRAQELAALFRDALAFDWLDAEGHVHFLTCAFHGATDSMETSGLAQQLDDAWLGVVELLVRHWPFDRLRDRDDGRFPVHTLVSVLEADADRHSQTRRFLSLVPTFEAILRDGDLADYCGLHFELRGLVAGRTRPVRGKREWCHGILMNESVEAALATLCRASVERVASWKATEKKTDDHGWIAGLDGRDSAALLKCWFDASKDRERTRRELAPLIDTLADAGKSWVAGELRTYVRRK